MHLFLLKASVKNVNQGYTYYTNGNVIPSFLTFKIYIIVLDYAYIFRYLIFELKFCLGPKIFFMHFTCQKFMPNFVP